MDIRFSTSDWEPVFRDSGAVAHLMARVFAGYPRAFQRDRKCQLSYAIQPLSCYERTVLLALQISGPDVSPLTVFTLCGPAYHQYVSGEAQDVYAVNLRDPPLLDEDERPTAEYLRLFLEISRGREGWRLVESVADIDWATPVTDREKAKLARAIKPLRLGAWDRQDRRTCRITVQRPGVLAERSLALSRDGLVVMGEEREILAHPALAAPPPITPFTMLRGLPALKAPARKATGPLIELVGMVDFEAAAVRKFPTVSGPSRSSTGNYDEHSLAIARILLAAAISRTAGQQRGRTPEGLVQQFFTHLGEFRPIVAIESPYQELRVDFATLVSEGCNLPVNLSWEGGPDARFVRAPMSLGEASVVLLTEATFPVNETDAGSSAASLLAPIIRGPHIGLIVTDRIHRLPQEARERVDRRLTIPRIDEALFRECCRVLFPRARFADDSLSSWVRYVLPRDLARAAAATGDAKAFMAEIENTVRLRLDRLTVPDAPLLSDLEGLGEARFRMQELAADIHAAVRGEIGWDQVDRGYLLVGPPGTGKTTLVRALAKECGVRFVLASASTWQEGSSLGPHLQNIRASFREARLFAPSIMFIDEIDALGTRNRASNANSYYENSVIDTVLEELQGFEDREGVVVIGATNHASNIDEALRRPGRLDRVIEVPFPNVAALARIYDFYLRRAAKAGFEIDRVDTLRLGKLTFGRTGGHVEVYVRGAMRRARREGGKTITETNLVAEITNKSPDGLGIVLSPDAMHRVAVHEAGHALVAMTGTTRDQDIAMISITPRADGTLGFVARGPDEFAYTTRDRMEEHVRVMLGGRAAEDVVFGTDQVSGGAGGSAGSDLARASQTVLWMLTVFGFSEAGGLLWVDWQPDEAARHATASAVRNLPMGDEILKEARLTLGRLYAETLERLISHRHALDLAVGLLIERQDLTPEEFRGVVETGSGLRVAANA
jgi:ATP-dependent Zn protease